jgi:hypothetical protein
VNGAPVVSNNGIVGYECDVWQEMHEESCYSGSLNVGFNLDVFTATIIPIPTLTAFPNISFDQKLYRGAVTTKLVKRTGILDKVTKMENGSTVSTRNLLWDAETGQVLLTETQNEFKDPIYQFSYPAHWEYDGMGLAYANDGMTVPAVTIAAGTAPEAVDSKLTHGDELLLVSTANGNNAGTRAYVVKVVRAGVPSDKQITDEAGNPVAGTFMLKVLRSGRRNLASTPIGSVTLLANPIQGTTLNLSSRVLNAQATLFRDDWAVRQANFAADCATTTGCLETGFVEMDCRRPMDGWKTFLQNFVAWKAEGRDLHMGSRTVYDFLAGDPRVQESDDFLCMGKPSELKCIEETGTIQSARTCLSYVSISYTRYEMLIINTNTNKQYKFVIEPAEWGEQPNNATGAVFLINERASVVPGLLATAEWRIKANMELNPVPLNEECQGYLRPHLEMEGCVRTGPIATNNSEVVLDPNIRVNPYQLGIKGNWRPYEAFAVNSRRVQGQTPSGTISSTLTAGDRNLNEPRILRGNGVIPINIVGTKYFEPFVWAGSIGTKSPVQNWYTERQQGKWVKTNTITHYDQKGNEIENKDALGIYSSALYRYQNTLASAVTANAQTRETAFDGFEDYMFNRNAVALGQTTLSTCYPAHWDMLRKQDQLLMANLTQDKAHTGNYSLKLPPQNPPFQKTLYMNESLAERLQNTENRAVLDNDNTKLDRVLPYFSLMPNKKYLISAWVSKKGECSPTDLSSLSLKIDGQAFKPAGPIIEGWQRIEGVVSWSTIPAEMNIEFSNPSNDIAYLDDIRILPFSAKMKSFAYDDRTMRLMAQLDENNYATFYEYDDEGSLVRTKKETERGVVTLQENRNYLRPN